MCFGYCLIFLLFYWLLIKTELQNRSTIITVNNHLLPTLSPNEIFVVLHKMLTDMNFSHGTDLPGCKTAVDFCH